MRLEFTLTPRDLRQHAREMAAGFAGMRVLVAALAGQRAELIAFERARLGGGA